MQRQTRVDAQWVVACLAPSDLAPHPNFSAETVDGPELLALLVQYKWREYELYATGGSATDVPTYQPAHPLVLAARMCLDSATIYEGLEALQHLTKDASASLGERAAAALLASVTSSELDMPEGYIDEMDLMANVIENEESRHRNSAILVAATLLQQCAFRSVESGRIDDARRYGQRVLRLVESITEDSRGWEDFSVSRGISWAAETCQRRVVELIAANANSLLMLTGLPGAPGWEDVVRAPFPAAQIRAVRDTSSALSAFMEQLFKRDLPSTRRVWTFGSGDTPARLLYSSLLNAELTGDLGEAQQGRSLLGTLFALRMARDELPEPETSEAIRLLRQANNDEGLGQLLLLLRMTGKLNAIRDATRQLLNRPPSEMYWKKADLTLISKGVDLVPLAMLPAALRAVDTYSRQGRKRADDSGDTQPDRTRLEAALQAVVDIISTADDYDASQVVRMVLDFPGLRARARQDQLLFSRVATLSQEVAWDRVDADARYEWIALIDAAAARGAALPIDLIRAASPLGDVVVRKYRERLDGLQFAVALVGGLAEDDVRPSSVDRAAEITEAILWDVKADAARGQYSGFAWSPFALAALLIDEYSRSELWRPLAACLTDVRVGGASKMEALQVLNEGRPRPDIPSSVRSMLAPDGAITFQTQGFFPEPIGKLDAVAFRFRITYELATIREAEARLIRDAGSSDSAIRREAAGSCGHLALRNPEKEWPRVLLLQLSHDEDATVHAEAIRRLGAVVLSTSGTLQQSITERATQILADQRIPSNLALLSSFLAASKGGERQAVPGWCRDLVKYVSQNHPSRLVRHVARDLLTDAKRTPES